jgi:hypothetical protein
VSPVRAVGSASTQSIRDGLDSRMAETRAAETARYLMTLDDETFARLVDKEISGELPPEVADVLGHPNVCHRWHHTIKALQVRCHMDGARSTTRMRSLLAERRARAVHAIRVADSTPGRIDSVGNKNKSARHRAIDRLIALHPDEFEALAAEEAAVPS